MYTPSYFNETRPEVLNRILDENSFGTLISVESGAPVLSHLPFMRETGADSRNRLVAHMAKANPHWRLFQDNPRVLVEFRGPHAYISPGWYPPSPTHVPTWNYVAVHVHGTARVVDDVERKWRVMEKLVRSNEAHYGTGWSVNAAGVQSMLAAIVVFEIEIERMEGKLKLSQQHPEELRQRVAHALLESTDSSIKATGNWMLQTRSVK